MTEQQKGHVIKSRGTTVRDVTIVDADGRPLDPGQVTTVLAPDDGADATAALQAAIDGQQEDAG